MVPVRIWDSLSIAPTPPLDGVRNPIDFSVRSAMPLRNAYLQTGDLPLGDSNIVVRALELLREQSGCLAGARVELVKRIPVAAGLGGGSSDAAAALRLGNHVWQLGWKHDQLAELAAELGSDVPFFLYDRAAFCRGRGERVEPLPAMPRLHFVILKPLQGISTAEVYRAHAALTAADGAARENSAQNLLSTARSGCWGNLRRWMTNRLQAAAAVISPWVEEARVVFARLDCVGHQLSGSGSAYFGICRHAHHAQRLAGILRSQGLGFVYTTSSC